MECVDTLIDIQSKYQKLSKGHRRLADYVLSNYDKVIFMTVNELSQTVGISESTVVRFAHSLGYAGYPSFQRNLQESIKTKLTTLQRFEHTSDAQGEKDVIKEVMHQDISNIEKTIRDLNTENIKMIAKKINSADTVYIIGFRSSKVLAEYLAFYLKFMHPNVRLVPVGANDIYDEVINAKHNDLAIAISFPRYSKLTIDLVDMLKERKVEIVGLTDSYHSPLAKRVSNIVTANFNIATFVDSLTAPMSLINALIISMSLDCHDELEEKFNELEEIWDKNNVYL
jgi:DNA-binding MurR/RpiR family transcriptional regulator